MTKSAASSNDHAPTMIMPRGTDITMDERGRLTVRAPGNIVLQNSGVFAVVESMNGSVRIDGDTRIEAVEIRCKETCYVQGSLVAWRVRAEELQVEAGGEAQVVLQETGRLQLGRGARMVGNFSSEEELFVLFSRFSSELKSLPFSAEAKAVEEIRAPRAARHLEEGEVELPEELYFAQALLEREGSGPDLSDTERQALSRVVSLLRAGDLASLAAQHQLLFRHLPVAGEGLVRARELIEAYFAQPSPVVSS